MLHDHKEMIELNPLVIEHHQIKAPRDAPADEFHCVWHSMTDKIQYLPGGLAKGKVTYKGCFYDMPNGLQTHIYAPVGLDIREKWYVGGSLPGEEREQPEFGVNKPREGLYLREDVNLSVNMLMMSFVRKNLDNAHKVLLERITRKMEIIENQEPGHVLNRADFRPGEVSGGRTGTMTGSAYTVSPSLAPSSPGFNAQDHPAYRAQQGRLSYGQGQFTGFDSRGHLVDAKSPHSSLSSAQYAQYNSTSNVPPVPIQGATFKSELPASIPGQYQYPHQPGPSPTAQLPTQPASNGGRTFMAELPADEMRLSAGLGIGNANGPARPNRDSYISSPNNSDYGAGYRDSTYVSSSGGVGPHRGSSMTHSQSHSDAGSSGNENNRDRSTVYSVSGGDPRASTYSELPSNDYRVDSGGQVVDANASQGQGQSPGQNLNQNQRSGSYGQNASPEMQQRNRFVPVRVPPP